MFESAESEMPFDLISRIQPRTFKTLHVVLVSVNMKENPYDSFMRKHLEHYGYYTANSWNKMESWGVGGGWVGGGIMWYNGEW
ncbi:hypothetical protein KUTeg_022875 [Tegillarca granosa]|uniref:Uncharacterized protein n=1 Tax=Tegillarca granosa TaxID=220873 RepID=A0ABQ9E5N7_TEGGR|nr:hypothetical protein KUTeg_022875 [Tegillarca granosa]